MRVLFPLPDSPIKTVKGLMSSIKISCIGPKFFMCIDSFMFSFFLKFRCHCCRSHSPTEWLSQCSGAPLHSSVAWTRVRYTSYVGIKIANLAFRLQLIGKNIPLTAFARHRVRLQIANGVFNVGVGVCRKETRIRCS